ncbi:hypothetical protein MCOR12_008327 [Pyricularia oryzae]|uniref:F-box domain-containing protein n=1 Tax=Pyricularia oryzae TaxID=318829 RepID=A0A4P7NIT8_PYROR|nr:hypothetical protein MCOR12_008327 [Pyricularia oryzae]QBZ61924.1 hypothetical protein PoMZ_08885 [Pyricularia oryzae]
MTKKRALRLSLRVVFRFAKFPKIDRQVGYVRYPDSPSGTSWRLTSVLGLAEQSKPVPAPVSMHSEIACRTSNEWCLVGQKNGRLSLFMGVFARVIQSPDSFSTHTYRDKLLSHLPLDILFLVLDQLEPPDLANLCLTSQCLHRAALPHLYKCLTLTDSLDSSSLAQRAARKHGALVRILRLTINFQGCADVTCDLCLHEASAKLRGHACWAVANPGGGLPPAAKELLEGYQGILPHLERIDVVFPAKVNHVPYEPNYFLHHSDPRSFLRLENMRLVTRAVTKALSRNETIAKLKLVNYPLLCPFGTDEAEGLAWQRLLDRMTEFDLCLFGDHGRAGGGMIDSSDPREPWPTFYSAI